MAKVGEGSFARRLLFTFKEAGNNLIRSPFMSLVVISTMMVALGVMGFLLLLLSDLHYVSDQLNSQMRILVHLEDQASLETMAAEIEKLEGVVVPVKQITKEEALDEMIEKLPDWKELMETQNPFPNSVEVEVVNLNLLDQIGQHITAMPGVEEVMYSKELAEQFKQIERAVNLVGITITTILFIATLAIIINTIQLAVHYRNKEIEIMRLVGASDWFIRLPFVIEGLIFGVLSAIIANILLVLWRLFPLMQIKRWFPFIPIQPSAMPLLQTGALVLLLGIIIGVVGSSLSVHRYLRLEKTR